MIQPVSAATRALGVPELLLEMVSGLDQADLYRAALVSRHWHSQAMVALYTRPWLYSAETADPTSAGRLESLVRTLVAEPALAGRVRGLFVGLPFRLSAVEGPVQELQLQARLMKLCVGLTSLELEGQYDTCLVVGPAGGAETGVWRAQATTE